MTALLKYDRARQLLAEARNVDEVMNLRDQARMMREYARIANDPQLEIDAATLRVYAERRLGEMLIAGKESGQISPGQPKKNPSPKEGFSRVKLEEAGITHKLSHRAQKRAGIGQRAFEGMVAKMRARMAEGGRVSFDTIIKETDLQRARRDHEQKTYEGGSVEDLHALIDQGEKFGVIYADPAWQFLSRGNHGDGRSASAHYTTTTLDDMKALPIAELAADDCVLFMWMVDWCPQDALDLIAAWGFTHKTTAFTWIKSTKANDAEFMGQGYWTRANPEDCWLATRGHPKRLNADVRQLMTSPIMEHSRKPDETYARIERLVAGPYLELFARRPHAGWKSWGNELPAVSPNDALTILHAENGGLEPGRDFDTSTGELITHPAHEAGVDLPPIDGPCCERDADGAEPRLNGHASIEGDSAGYEEDDEEAPAERVDDQPAPLQAAGHDDLDIPPFLRRAS
jgi:N6-adenosine-specific RNA methylase IME4